MATPRVVRASTCRRSVCVSRRRRAEDLHLAAVMAAEGVDFLAVSFVRAAETCSVSATRLHR